MKILNSGWSWIVATGLVCVMGMPGRSAQEDGYFLPWEASSAGVSTERGVFLENVEPGGAADRAGVRSGDEVLAVNGLRCLDSYEFRFLTLQGPDPIQVVLRRQNELKTVEVSGLVNKRMQVTFPMGRGAFAGLLQSTYGLKPSQYVGSVNGPRNDNGLLDQLVNAYAPGERTRPGGRALMATDEGPDPSLIPVHPLFLRVERFPGRARADLEKLGAASKDPAVRDWVLSLVRVYVMLTEERYEDAQRLIRESRLTERKPGPFLERLAAFYARIAAQPPSPDTGPPPDGYGVSPTFAVFCHPMPIRVHRRYDWTRIHPAIGQAINEMRDHWPDQDSGREGRVYGLGGALKGLSFAGWGVYMSSVADSMISPRSHGGWPMRSTFIFNEDSRKTFLGHYRELIASKSKYSALAAMSMIVPAVIEDDWDSYGIACNTLAEAGTLELAYAGYLTHQACQMWSLDRPKIRSVLRAVDKKTGIPPLVQWLEKQSEDLRKRTAFGYSSYDEGTAIEPGVYLPNLPGIMLKAWPAGSP